VNSKFDVLSTLVMKLALPLASWSIVRISLLTGEAVSLQVSKVTLGVGVFVADTVCVGAGLVGASVGVAVVGALIGVVGNPVVGAEVGLVVGAEVGLVVGAEVRLDPGAVGVATAERQIFHPVLV